MKTKRLLITVIAVVVIAVIAIFGIIKIKGYLPYYFDKKGINQPDISYTLTIEKSDFENEVALRLEKEGIIVSAVRFLGYIHETYPDFVWYNGTYNLTADMSYKELCEKLKNPDERIDYVKFTVPEGKNIRGIAKIIEESGLCTADEFLKAADSYDYDYAFIDDLKARDQSLISYKLEGYLFPATYEFRRDTVTPSEIVDKMLAAFDGYVTDTIIKKADDMGLTVNELISFASVIQAEAFSKESMKNISSVFWNRLNSNHTRQLQSDPTTTYAKTLKNLPHYTEAMYKAYNTYNCIGIPVGPINSPGLDTIEAVLDPVDSNWFYFVTDSNGKFYYNETLNGHNSTIRSLKNQGLWG